MRIYFAYVSVVLLWATTPLAIKLSGEGPGFLFAATSRMTIGTFCMLLTLTLLRKPLPWHRKALTTYLAVSLQIYGSMVTVYWAAQFIPSGWISVLFGLVPLLTALMATLLLGEKHLTISKLIANGLGVYGLTIMFGSAVSLGDYAELGIIGILFAALLQTISSVWIKCIDAKLPALTQVTGGLIIALPLYLATWALMDGQWPRRLTEVNLYAILYLGVIATTIGFYLYYYLLTHLAATKVALISLMTPVMALMLGNLVNHEPLSKQTITGTTFILSALLMHELIDHLIFLTLKFRKKN